MSSNCQTLECRFCLEAEPKKTLITPCLCTGSIAYVHHNCLMRWYHTNPEIGLQCSICKEELAKKVLFPFEIGSGREEYIIGGLHHPFLTVFGWHWFFLCLLGAVYTIFQQAPIMTLYTGFQVGFHIRYGIVLFQFSSAIQAKSRYWRAWRSRAGLLCLHMLFLALFPEIQWVAGVVADLCCIQYIKIHFQIVAELNSKHSFQFVSRQPQQLLCLESS